MRHQVAPGHGHHMPSASPQQDVWGGSTTHSVPLCHGAPTSAPPRSLPMAHHAWGTHGG